MKTILELSDFIKSNIEAATSPEQQEIVRDWLAKEIVGSPDKAFLLLAKSSYSNDEMIIIKKMGVLFEMDIMPAGHQKDERKKSRLAMLLKVIAIIGYFLVLLVTLLACIVSICMHAILAITYWGYAYGSMSIRTSNFMSVIGLTTSVTCFVLIGCIMSSKDCWKWFEEKIGLK